MRVGSCLCLKSVIFVLDQDLGQRCEFWVVVVEGDKKTYHFLRSLEVGRSRLFAKTQKFVVAPGAVVRLFFGKRLVVALGHLTLFARHKL